MFRSTLARQHPIGDWHLHPGGQEIDLAVERGEIHCRAFTIEAFLSREPYHTWRKKGFVRNIIQTGKKRDRKMVDTPTVWELMDKYKTPEASRRLASVMLASGTLGRPMLGTPGIPAERVKMLRDAFNKTMEDKEFLADLDKRSFDLDPVTGEELETLVKEVMSQPPDIIVQNEEVTGSGIEEWSGGVMGVVGYWESVPNTRILPYSIAISRYRYSPSM